MNLCNAQSLLFQGESLSGSQTLASVLWSIELFSSSCTSNDRLHAAPMQCYGMVWYGVVLHAAPWEFSHRRVPARGPKAVTGKSPPDGGRAVSLHESRLIWHRRGFISRRGSARQLSSLPVRRRRGGEKLKEWVMERYSHVAPEISIATM